MNLGVDLRMFDNRLSATFEYFYNRRNDIMSTPKSVPLYAGYMDGVLPMMNIGRTENKGWDAEFTWRDKIGNDFSYFSVESYRMPKIKFFIWGKLLVLMY